jgi:universal stress protein E
MHRVNRVIVGVEMPKSRPWNAANLTAPTRLAVRQAFEVAKAMNATVDLVCVLAEASAGFFGSKEDAAAQSKTDQAEAEYVLTDLVEQYTRDSPVKTTTKVTFGRPWLEILKVAGTSRDNLILCGTRSQGAVSRLLFGSTGQKILRNATCPVWLVKPRIDDDADLDVLAATDLSEMGEDILHAAVTLGRSLPVRLSVLHVVDDALSRHMAHTGVSEETLAEYRKKEKESAEGTLQNQLAMTDYRTIEKGVQVHIAEGSADGCILSAIKELDIDLLIMATSARGGIPGMLFGTTAERLLPELPCSILVLKPDDFECPVSLD